MKKNNIFKHLLRYFDEQGYFNDDYYPVDAIGEFYKDVCRGKVPEDLTRAYCNFNVDDELTFLRSFINEYDSRLNDIVESEKQNRKHNYVLTNDPDSYIKSILFGEDNNIIRVTKTAKRSEAEVFVKDEALLQTFMDKYGYQKEYITSEED